MKSFKKSKIKLTASLKAVIAQFHHLPNNNRVINIVKRVEALNEKEVDNTLKNVMREFSQRHKNFEELLMDNFHRVEEIHEDLSHFTENKKLLLGSYLTKEYSFQAAALFNPSIVPHPDQTGLKKGEQRFVMSLRATGEGHISSIIFNTGIVTKKGIVTPDKTSGFYSILKKGETTLKPKGEVKSAEEIKELLETNYDLISASNLSLSEKVIFPSAGCERMGMEDLRLVKFLDGEHSCYYGTYTAYDGKNIRTMLLETNDFDSFRVRSLHGNAINDKGMALFPEKVGGKFVKCSRQGSELLSIMFSDDLYRWENYQLLLEPKYEWEFVQMGNCGSPVKTKKGWLMLTHGVGPMRKYVISAILLDLQDPSKIIGRLSRPMITADEEEREGYVPNVVYTCGMLKHNNLLIIPYGISDAATIFASVEIDEVLNAMKS
jgi:predicted GH43/DUF377 family glycosyl hydrolase